MRQRSNTAPFHRRILLWIFIIAFLVIAPSLIFYTSGYRWNPKKGQVDRNGTVIFDSTPTAADITIDDRPTTLQTPVTIQDMPPGFHRFKISKPGYSTWEKTLEVKAERVTFANTAWLWKHTEPEFLIDTSSTLLSSRPRDTSLLTLIHASPTVAMITDQRGVIQHRFAFPETLNGSYQPFWSSNGRGLLLRANSRSDSSDWLIDTRGTHPPFQLPPGNYRWSNSTLTGVDGSSLISIQLPSFTLSRTSFPPHISDQLLNADLRTPTGTTQLAYVSRADPTRGFALPPGQWTFWSENGNLTILRDGTRWLSLQTKNGNPEYHIANGKELLLPPVKTLNENLLLHETELWLWNPLFDPELLYRQSDHIVNAVWEAHGATVFYATTKGVFAIDLDSRDGHIITELATFDEITGLATTDGKSLFVSGTKNDKTGLWTLAVE